MPPFALGMLLSATVAVAAPSPIVVERELMAGRADSFEVVAQAGQVVRALLVERRGDLAATIYGPDGQALVENAVTEGREPVSIIAPATGSYIVMLRGIRQSKATDINNYTFTVVAMPGRR